jgi:hypothetical protein
LKTGLRATPLPVSPYSTFGGTCGCIVRRTIPSRSSPRSCWISIFCEILGMALSNSESRRMGFAHNRERIIIFHRPSKHARAFSISPAFMSICLLLQFLFRDAMRISPSLCLALWYVHAYLKTQRRGGPVIRIVESPSSLTQSVRQGVVAKTVPFDNTIVVPERFIYPSGRAPLRLSFGSSLLSIHRTDTECPRVILNALQKRFRAIRNTFTF